MRDTAVTATTNHRSDPPNPEGRTVAATQPQLALRLTRRLAAPRALVFAMWTDPEALAQWWGPQGFTTPTIALDVRTGGGYRIEMLPPDGERFFLAGEFCDVDAPARVRYT